MSTNESNLSDILSEKEAQNIDINLQKQDDDVKYDITQLELNN